MTDLNAAWQAPGQPGAVPPTTTSRPRRPAHPGGAGELLTEGTGVGGVDPTSGVSGTARKPAELVDDQPRPALVDRGLVGPPARPPCCWPRLVCIFGAFIFAAAACSPWPAASSLLSLGLFARPHASHEP